jgi:hypothetical protein
VLVSGAVEVFRARGRTFACHRVTHRRRWLGDIPFSSSETTISVRQLRVRGDMLAYEIRQSRLELELGVAVIDVRRGRELLDVDALSTLGPPTQSSRSAITALDVTAQGVPVWIARNPYADPEVHEVATVRAGKREQLASSTAIAPRSLALADDRTAYWLDGGVVRSALIGSG